MLDITKSCSAPNFNVGHYLQPVQPQTLMLDITCNCSAQTFVPATNTGTIQLYHLTLLPVTLTWLRVTWPINGKTYMCHFLAHFWTDLDEISCGVDVEHPYTMFCEILLMKENKLFSADWIFEKRLKKKKKCICMYSDRVVYWKPKTTNRNKAKQNQQQSILMCTFL